MRNETLYAIVFCIYMITVAFLAYFVSPWILLLFLFTKFELDSSKKDKD